MRDLAYHALSARDALLKKKGADPTISEIAEFLNENGNSHTNEEISSALEAITEPISLYDPVYGDGSSADSIFVMDQICDSSSAEDFWLENIALKEALKNLSEREKSILSMRFYKGKTQMEIASEIGISQAQVSRLEKCALDRIKKQL